MRPQPISPDRFFRNVGLTILGVAVAAPWIVTGAVHYYTWVFAVTRTVFP